MAVLTLGSGPARGELIYQEGFNDDGDGTRYELIGRGQEVLDVGPGMWEHNFLVDQIGLVTSAPAKRAAILWTHTAPFDVPPEELWAPETFEVWTSLVNWATDGKQNARIGFFPGYEFAESTIVLGDVLSSAGHQLSEVFDVSELPDPGDIDLLIHTSEGTPDPPTAFANYPVPIISFDAPNHDDTLIAGIGGTINFPEAVNLKVAPGGEGHPALGGKTGVVPWTVEYAELEGMGKIPPGGKVLLTYEDPDTGEDMPALAVIEEGGGLLGAFDPQPEGTGYIVGGDLDAFFGDQENPRVLQLRPVDVTGKSDVKMTVALAGTDADFENSDFLRVLIDPNNSGNFQVLTEFIGNANKALGNDTIELRPDAFTDVTFDIPEGATNLVVRFEAFNTFPNEILAIDNVRIFSGTLQIGDFNGDGVLDVADINDLATTIQTGGGGAQFDLNGDGTVDGSDHRHWVKEVRKTWVGDANLDGEFNSGDFVQVFQAGRFETGTAAGWEHGDWNGDGTFNSGDFVAAFQDGGFEQGPVQAVSAVPEPSGAALMLLGLLGLLARVRRR